MAVPTSPLLSLTYWVLGTLISSLICLLLGFISIKAIVHVTADIKEFNAIRNNGVAIALFVGGFLIFTGLIIHGATLNPIFQGNVLDVTSFVNTNRFLVVILAYGVSLAIGWIFYHLFARMELFGIDLDEINASPQAVGLFLFSYEVFLGIIVHASLALPL